MNGELRRRLIWEELNVSPTAVSCAVLKQKYGVSRQVIVGDVALLKAEGKTIISTTRGYWVPKGSGLRERIFCVHSKEDRSTELKCIIELGGRILDLQIQHTVYGLITVQLNLSTLADVQKYVSSMSSCIDLPEITAGAHSHLVEFQSKQAYDRMVELLIEMGFTKV